MLLYDSRQPETPSFAPSFDGLQAERSALDQLWTATRELQLYRDNSNAEFSARREAYERRNARIHELTGTQLVNPLRPEIDAAEIENRPEIFAPGSEQARLERIGEREGEWKGKIRELAAAFPALEQELMPAASMRDQALGVTREAERAFETALAGTAGVSADRRIGTMIAAGGLGMLRDPLQVATLFLGGAPSSARWAATRIAQIALQEAAINGGVELAVQAASQSWRAEAGVEHGLSPALEQAGLAALFGGGLGGLVAGGAEVFKALGRTPPQARLDRLAAGDATADDIATLAEAAGRPLTDQERATVALAIEQERLDADAFGPPPAGVRPEDATALAADALRAVEDDAPLQAIGPDVQARRDRLDAILRREFPAGKRPRKPMPLIDFLASKGGIADESGALSALGLKRRFVPGAGPLVRPTGRSLDYARELAAEAGYLDHLYGSADEASARSTPDDLLRLLEEEAAGRPQYSSREADLAADSAEWETRQKERDAFRALLDDVDAAADEWEFPDGPGDAVLARAARFMAEDGEDPASALERAIEEDYRRFTDALAERDEGLSDDFSQLPFFAEDAAQPGRAARAGGPSEGGGGETPGGGRGAAAEPGGRLPDGGGDAREEGGELAFEPAADTPEPATPQAGELAALALTEARGASEATAAGEQTLIPGVRPVSTKEKLEAQAAKPMRGGDAAPAEGGLFDENARAQPDLWDVMPAARDADGNTTHVTYEQMVEDADQAESLADLIKHCKD